VDTLGKPADQARLRPGRPAGHTIEPEPRSTSQLVHGFRLRGVGYDGPLNIEHEDTLVNSIEGVRRAATLLKEVVLVEPADWKPANI
jgi:hypothetical protein